MSFSCEYDEEYFDQWDQESQEVVPVSFCKRVKETDLAMQYDFNDNVFEPDRHWLPKSQIVNEDVNPDGTGMIEIPRWLAEQEGLI